MAREETRPATRPINQLIMFIGDGPRGCHEKPTSWLSCLESERRSSSTARFRSSPGR
ncbi:MAG TPA: hypothetical protein VOA87_14955 [Thermoanaerobaculia bacterium]|nr:hypothetical protein [Thermoanaerobaculia bacterium]